MADAKRVIASTFTNLIKDAPAELTAGRIRFYQPNSDYRRDDDIYQTVSHRLLVPPGSVVAYNYTGFSIPLSRKYRIRLSVQNPWAIVTRYAIDFSFDDNNTASIAVIIPRIMRKSYDGTVNYFSEMFINRSFNTGLYQTGAIFASMESNIPANSNLRSYTSLSEITAIQEVEVDLYAGDFIFFDAGIYCEPDIGPSPNPLYKIQGFPIPFPSEGVPGGTDGYLIYDFCISITQIDD